MALFPVALIDNARRAFAHRTGRPATCVAIAPGRLNLMGDHTDYEGGLVLPMAVERWLAVAAGPREGRQTSAQAHVWSELEGDVAELDGNDPPRRGTWADYAAGILHHSRARGIRPPPFEAVICSEIPAGAGLFQLGGPRGGPRACWSSPWPM